jgi:NADH dehydrogenase [ubiquinone] 1 alpha subcomplex assembly factor 5
MKPTSFRPWLPWPVLRRRVVEPRRWFETSPSRAAVQSPGAPTLEIFNQHTKYLQKERAAANVADSRKVDYLKDEVARRLTDRLLDINRNFPLVLDLGANSCNIARALSKPPIPPPGSEDETPPEAINKIPLENRISHLICAETSPRLLHRDDDLEPPAVSIEYSHLPSLETLTYPPSHFDAVLSSLSLHWVNDLPSLLSSINAVLKPDAPFIAAMFGGDTLFELRTSLQLADLERKGGVSPHISPMADTRDVGGLLTRAGFKLLTVDVDDIIVEYPDTFALMADVQAMGEGNATLKSISGPISRDVLLANEAIYRELHCTEEEKEGGKIPATFRIIYMIGWKEGEGQQKPLPRGSGQVNIKDILGGGEIK